jgi:flagellar biosynthesis/type III secretory pathway chaperone
MIEAVEALCAVLDQENTALTTMDVVRATALLDEKQRAVQAFVAATKLPIPPTTKQLMLLGQHLRDLTDTNKRLLERAMVAQNRVMACIARAVPRALQQQSGYGAQGAKTIPRGIPPVALSNQA